MSADTAGDRIVHRLQRLISSRWLFVGLAAIALAVGFLGRHQLPPRARALLGVVCFLSLVAGLSAAPGAIRWKQVGKGLLLQLLLAFGILKFSVAGHRPLYEGFQWLAKGVQGFLGFAAAGSEFVFGSLAKQDPGSPGVVFAFKVLPTIVFVSAVFAVLQHLGVLRWVVRLMARPMVWLLGTSGAETLSVTAGTFLGQTEAPMTIRNFLPNMTRSELTTVMTSGFAHISAAMIAVYIGYKIDPVGILATSVLAAPATLYLSKIAFPEREKPETLGQVQVSAGSKLYANALDALAGGTTQGLRLAANVGAMLIAFLAVIAMLDKGLGALHSGLSLKQIFAVAFSPNAALLGTPSEDVASMGTLLGYKLTSNEHIAFTCLVGSRPGCESLSAQMSPLGKQIAAFALAGFANFASVGIQLGGIGGMAPSRRADLAKLIPRALLVGFVVTLLNACLAVLVGLA